MDAHDAIDVNVIKEAKSLLCASRAIIVDANLRAPALAALAAVLEDGKREGISSSPPLIFEPISVTKSSRILTAQALNSCALIKPNRLEVIALASVIRADMGLPPLPVPEVMGTGDNAHVEEMAAEGGDNEEEGSGNDFSSSSLDYRTLVAAQTVLAGMMRPGGMNATQIPISHTALAVAWKGLESPQGQEALNGVKVGAAAVTAAVSPSSAITRGLIDGRVHVLVSLGADGALWLSAKPSSSIVTSDLAFALPFFAAAQHADINFDFQLIPAPIAHVRKATGAGDALVGAIVWALAVKGESMAEALRWGLATAHAVLEHEPEQGHGGAVPRNLSIQSIEERRKLVANVEVEYT